MLYYADWFEDKQAYYVFDSDGDWGGGGYTTIEDAQSEADKMNDTKGHTEVLFRLSPNEMKKLCGEGDCIEQAIRSIVMDKIRGC